jgi:hypothetical protein
MRRPIDQTTTPPLPPPIHGPARPRDHARRRSGLGERLSARALVQAMEPVWEARAAATSLAGLAGGDETALRRALARIQLHSSDRTAPVAERAMEALRLAIQQARETPTPPSPTAA